MADLELIYKQGYSNFIWGDGQNPYEPGSEGYKKWKEVMMQLIMLRYAVNTK